MTESTDASALADLPCPKCGHTEVTMLYEAGGVTYESRHRMCYQAISGSSVPTNALPEHFHHTCQRCKYQWATFDVLSA